MFRKASMWDSGPQISSLLGVGRAEAVWVELSLYIWNENNLKVMAEKRTLGNGSFQQFSFEEKQIFAAVVQKSKLEYEQELMWLKCKTHWNTKWKRLIPDTSK